MRQKIYARYEYDHGTNRTTCWGRIKPGHKGSLERAMWRALSWSEQLRIVEGATDNAHHLLTAADIDPPWSFDEFLADYSPFTPSNYFEKHKAEGARIYELFSVSNTEVKEINLPAGIVYLGYYELAALCFDEDLKAAAERSRAETAQAWEKIVAELEASKDA